MPFHHVCLADQRNQALLHQLLHVCTPGHALHHHHELVAPQAADRILPAHRLRQPGSHRAQQPVADVVAQGVVDALEAVQVDEQHRHLRVHRPGLRQRRLQALLAQRAIGQLRQHIMVRQEADALHVELAVGDVNGDADVVRHRTALAAFAYGRHHEPGRIGLARAAAKAHLALPGFALAHGVQDTLAQRRIATVLVQQQAQPLTQQFVEVVVRAAAERLVHAEDVQVRPHDDDALGRCLEDLGPQLQALLHDLEHIDRCERRQHRITPLKTQPPRRQHGPQRLAIALPAHLELIDDIMVGQPLEESRTYPGLQALAPGVALHAVEPGACRRVRMQHLVFGNGGHHHGNGQGFDQFALGLRGPCTGRQFLLLQAFAVELGQHLVERRHQAADFVAAVPVRTQTVVAAAAHLVGHPRQVLQGLGNLPRHQRDQAQNATKQQHRRPHMQPHAVKLQVHPVFQQTAHLHRGHVPRIAQRHQRLLAAGLQRRQISRHTARGNRMQPVQELRDVAAQSLARHVQSVPQSRIAGNERLAVV